MTGAKKSAFAGQGKGWRKGVKGIGVKKKPSDGDEPVRRKKHKAKPPQNGDGEAFANVKQEQAGTEGTGEDWAEDEAQLSKRAVPEAGVVEEGMPVKGDTEEASGEESAFKAMWPA